jgi:hypothetical protein
MFLSLSMNLVLINQASSGISGKAIGIVDLCINHPPNPIFDNCDSNLTALIPFYCQVNTTDFGENDQYLFTDNATLFAIEPFTGIISFTPDIDDIGNHSVNITVSDGSGCSNAIASGIWNFTINEMDLNDTLEVFSETDIMTKYKYDPVIFYANYTDYFTLAPIENANCSIEFNSTGNYSFADDMIYNNTLQLYTYNNAFGFLQGNHTFRVTCNGMDEGYGVRQVTNNFTITNKLPYVYAQFPNLTIRQGTSLFGYNLNDYFKDEDLDMLSFFNFLMPNINIEISASGDITVRPDAWFYGNRSTFFTATDGFGNVQGNVFTITVQQVTVTPSSGSGSGGGGGGRSPVIICKEDWECDEWGPCTPQGFEYRECEDKNKCFSTYSIPELVRECEYIGTCSDGIKNCHEGACETGVDCGGPCEPCASCYDGIQNQGETGVDCGGPCDPCSALPPREERPQGIVISPEIRKTGTSILLILLIVGASLMIISYIMHSQIATRISQLSAYPATKGSIAHVSSEARAVIAIEMARTEKNLPFKDRVAKISSAFQMIVKKHINEETSMTLEQIRNKAIDVGNEKIARKIIHVSQIIEESEYTKLNDQKDLEYIVDSMLSLVHGLIHTKIHDDQVKKASQSSSKLKHSFIKALLDVSDSLIMERRIYSAAMLVHEALIYYKQIKPSKLIKQRMEKTIAELNKAVQSAREERNG